MIGEEGTIEFWFKPDWDGGDGKDYRIFDASLGDKYFYIGSDTQNQMGIYVEDVPDRHWHTMIDLNETVVEADKWYHLAATWKFGVEAAFYLNGELGLKTDISANPLGALPPFAAASRIGRSTETQYAAANSANGTIDELKIYSRALDPDEIKQAMEAKSAVDFTAKVATTWGELKS
ncbi:LamG domain-containing protein [Candidatus Poribacteria bacterium]